MLHGNGSTTVSCLPLTQDPIVAAVVEPYGRALRSDRGHGNAAVADAPGAGGADFGERGGPSCVVVLELLKAAPVGPRSACR